MSLSPHFLNHASRIPDSASTRFGSTEDFARCPPAIGARPRPRQCCGSAARSMSRTEMLWAVALAAAFMAITVVLGSHTDWGDAAGSLCRVLARPPRARNARRNQVAGFNGRRDRLHEQRDRAAGSVARAPNPTTSAGKCQYYPKGQYRLCQFSVSISHGAPGCSRYPTPKDSCRLSTAEEVSRML